MDIFGIKRRKAEKEAARLANEKKENERLDKIHEEFEILKSRAQIENDNSIKTLNGYAKRLNETCPKCKSKNVNERIQRIQGDIHGSVSGTSSLFGGYMHGSVKGSLDTNEVNKCNDCNNEWKKYKPEFSYYADLMENYFNRINWLHDEYKKAITTKVDRTLLSETYKNDEEKRTALINQFSKSVRLKQTKTYFEGISIETIIKTAEQYIWPFSVNKYELESFKEDFNEIFMIEQLGIKHLE